MEKYTKEILAFIHCCFIVITISWFGYEGNMIHSKMKRKYVTAI